MTENSIEELKLLANAYREQKSLLKKINESMKELEVKILNKIANLKVSGAKTDE